MARVDFGDNRDLLDQAAGMRVDFGGASPTNTGNVFSGVDGSPVGMYQDATTTGGDLVYGVSSPFLDTPMPSGFAPAVDPRNTVARQMLEAYGFGGAVDRYRERFLSGNELVVAPGGGRQESPMGDNDMASIIEAVKQRIESIVSPQVDNTRRGRFGF